LIETHHQLIYDFSTLKLLNKPMLKSSSWVSTGMIN